MPEYGNGLLPQQEASNSKQPIGGSSWRRNRGASLGFHLLRGVIGNSVFVAVEFIDFQF